MSNRIITLEDLTSRNACSEQVEMFKVAYPDGFEVTEANMLEALANGFDVFWTQCLLSDSAGEVYDAVHDSAYKVCDAATRPAREALAAAVAPAREVYDAVRDSALEVCHAATARDSAYQTYLAAIAPAREVYDAAIAPAWDSFEVECVKALVIALNS